TTHGFSNHGVRNEGWRYIRYENGDEELYNETTDPNEWTNLAKDPQYADRKTAMAAFMPKTNQPPAKQTEGKMEKKREKRKKMEK
ncbi:MAG: iduronate-2-sulfatase, partial [Prosthecobacter sp.]